MKNTTCVLSTQELSYLSKIKAQMLLHGYADVQSGGLVRFLLENGIPLLSSNDEPVGRGRYSSPAEANVVANRFGFSIDPHKKTLSANSFLELSFEDQSDFISKAENWLESNGKEMCKYLLSFYIPDSFDAYQSHLTCSQAVRVILRDYGKKLLSTLSSVETNTIQGKGRSTVSSLPDFLSVSLDDDVSIDTDALMNAIERYKPSQARSYFLALLEKHLKITEYAVKTGVNSPGIFLLKHGMPQPLDEIDANSALIVKASYQLRRKVISEFRNLDLLLADLKHHYDFTMKEKVLDQGELVKVKNDETYQAASLAFLSGYYDLHSSVFKDQQNVSHIFTPAEIDWIRSTEEIAVGIFGYHEISINQWFDGLYEEAHGSGSSLHGFSKTIRPEDSI